jgi:hypothetical protein
MTTYKTLFWQVKCSPRIEDLSYMEGKVTRHYEKGTITARELSRLDVAIMVLRAEFETGER